jgi:hypothetical protein
MFGEVTVGPGFTGRAGGQLIYQIQIIGPAAEMPVACLITLMPDYGFVCS